MVNSKEERLLRTKEDCSSIVQANACTVFKLQMHELGSTVPVKRAVRIVNRFNKTVRSYNARSTFHTVPFYRRFVRTVAPLNCVKTGTLFWCLLYGYSIQYHSECNSSTEFVWAMVCYNRVCILVTLTSKYSYLVAIAERSMELFLHCVSLCLIVVIVLCLIG